MPNARVIEVVEAMKDSLVAAWSPSGDDGVSREYLGEFAGPDLHAARGRKVFLFPGPYTMEPGTRSETLHGYRVGAVILEPYKDADKPTSAAMRDWLDERVYFVQQYIADGLDFGGANEFLTIDGREIWTETIEVVELYDAERLERDKVFRSEVSFLMREQKAG